MPRPRLSIEAQLALLATGLVALATLVALFIQRRIGDGPLSALFTFALLVPVSLWVASRWARPVSRLMRAVGDAALSFQDGDFSMSIGTRRRDELGDLVDQVNQVGDVLRRERQGVFQRELLLDTVIQSSPLALVLTDSAGHVIYSNVVARQMFLDGRKLEGFTPDYDPRRKAFTLFPKDDRGNVERVIVFNDAIKNIWFDE